MTNRPGLLCSAIVATVLSTAAASHGEAPMFTNGDRVAFIGDSITHDGTYHAFIYDFYLTRFPGRRVAFLNCGISGDMPGVPTHGSSGTSSPSTLPPPPSCLA